MGNKKKLSVKANGKVKWKSNKKKVATVSSKGVVKAVKKGTAKITAYNRNSNAVCIVNVIEKKVKDSAAAPSASPAPTKRPEIDYTNMRMPLGCGNLLVESIEEKDDETVYIHFSKWGDSTYTVFDSYNVKYLVVEIKKDIISKSNKPINVGDRASFIYFPDKGKWDVKDDTLFLTGLDIISIENNNDYNLPDPTMPTQAPVAGIPKQPTDPDRTPAPTAIPDPDRTPAPTAIPDPEEPANPRIDSFFYMDYEEFEPSMLPTPGPRNIETDRPCPEYHLDFLSYNPINKGDTLVPAVMTTGGYWGFYVAYISENNDGSITIGIISKIGKARFDIKPSTRVMVNGYLAPCESRTNSFVSFTEMGDPMSYKDIMIGDIVDIVFYNGGGYGNGVVGVNVHVKN